MNWRLRLVTSGVSWSQRMYLQTPASASAVMTFTPKPPHPAMPTLASIILCCPSSPNIGICLSNLLRVSPR